MSVDFYRHVTALDHWTSTLVDFSTGPLVSTSVDVSTESVNYYELLATCSKYSIHVNDMSENITKQTI